MSGESLPWDLIRSAAKRYRLDPSLVAAVCMIESNGNTWATRVEFERLDDGNWRSRWRWWLNPIVFARKVGSSITTERVSQATSFGLMQVMGAVAREHGYNGWLTGLCDPSTGIEYGCMHLRKKIDTWGSTENGVEAYNAGRPGRIVGIQYRQKVYRKLEEIKGG